jgi:hypothetical protein
MDLMSSAVIVMLVVYSVGTVAWLIYFEALHNGARERPTQYVEGTRRYAARGVLLTPVWPAALVIAAVIQVGKMIGRAAVDAMKED